jgi:hypothetical protein
MLALRLAEHAHYFVAHEQAMNGEITSGPFWSCAIAANKKTARILSNAGGLVRAGV